jgi:hypothetical protein
VRNLDWKDDQTMATASVHPSPGSFKFHRLLATVLFQSDRNYSNIDRVIAEATRGLAILGTLPNDLDVSNPWNLAASYSSPKAIL